MEWLAEAEHGVASFVVRIVEESVVMFLFASFVDDFDAIAQDHVINTLVRGTRHFWVFADDVDILFESSDPILTTELSLQQCGNGRISPSNLC